MVRYGDSSFLIASLADPLRGRETENRSWGGRGLQAGDTQYNPMPECIAPGGVPLGFTAVIALCP